MISRMLFFILLQQCQRVICAVIVHNYHFIEVFVHVLAEKTFYRIYYEPGPVIGTYNRRYLVRILHWS